jgi:enoyl-CoA hydratase/carnithine racemase
MSVTCTLEENIAVIQFDDGKANVFSHKALEDLTSALDQAKEARAVLLVGRPGRFSAGFDLATMTASTESMRGLVKAGAHFISRLLLEPLPVVAACTGHALAAGALVLLASDYRVGVEGDWKIGLNEVSIGMPLPVWAVELARYRMPASEFDRGAILGQTVGPDAAVAAGFLDRVVPADDLLSEAKATAMHLAGLRTGAVADTKSRARRDLVATMLEGLDDDLARISGPGAD